MLATCASMGSMKKLTLHAIEFGEDTPTPSAIADTCEKINEFLQRLMGSVMAEGEGQSVDQKVGAVLNAGGMLRQAADAWRGTSNIAVPQLRPMAVPPNQRQ